MQEPGENWVALRQRHKPPYYHPINMVRLSIRFIVGRVLPGYDRHVILASNLRAKARVVFDTGSTNLWIASVLCKAWLVTRIHDRRMTGRYWNV